MENHPQGNNTEQMILKHNWTKFKPINQELNDDFILDSPQDNAECLKPKIFREEEKVIPSEDVKNALDTEAKNIRFHNWQVREASNYIAEHPGEPYWSQFTIIRIAAEFGHSPGQYQLGKCYLFGYGCEKSEEKAVEWHNKAIINGYDPESDFKNENRNENENKCYIS